MPVWFSGALSAVGGFFSGLAGTVLKWAGVILAYRLGIRRERQKSAERTVEIKEKQLEIASKPPLHRSDLLERMRGRKRT